MRRLDFSISRFLDLALVVLVSGSLLLVIAEVPIISAAVRSVPSFSPFGAAALFASMALYACAHVGRAIRLQLIIGVGRIPFRALLGFHSLLALASFFTPLKLGDLIRAVEAFRLLKNDMRGPFAVWIDRLLDAAMLVVVLSALSYVDPPAIQSSVAIILIAAALVLGGSAAIVLVLPGALTGLARAMLSSRSRGSLLILEACAHVLALGRQFPRLSIQTLSLLAVLTLTIWLFELGAVFLILAGVSLPASELPESAAAVYSGVLIGSADQMDSYVAVYYAMAIVALGLLTVVTAGRYLSVRLTAAKAQNTTPIHRATSPFRNGQQIRGRAR